MGRAEPARPCAAAHGLAIDGLPSVGPPDLFSQTEHDDSEEQVRSDGYLSPESADGGWVASAERAGRWAGLVLNVATCQQTQLDRLVERPPASSVAGRSLPPSYKAWNLARSDMECRKLKSLIRNIGND